MISDKCLLRKSSKSSGEIASLMGRLFQKESASIARDFQKLRWISLNQLDEVIKDLFSETKTAYQIAKMVNQNIGNTVPIEQYEWIPKHKVLNWLGKGDTK